MEQAVAELKSNLNNSFNYSDSINLKLHTKQKFTHYLLCTKMSAEYSQEFKICIFKHCLQLVKIWVLSLINRNVILCIIIIDIKFGSRHILHAQRVKSILKCGKNM